MLRGISLANRYLEVDPTRTSRCTLLRNHHLTFGHISSGTTAALAAESDPIWGRQDPVDGLSRGVRDDRRLARG
jgi:hypothetical protein